MGLALHCDPPAMSCEVPLCRQNGYWRLGKTGAVSTCAWRKPAPTVRKPWRCQVS